MSRSKCIVSAALCLLAVVVIVMQCLRLKADNPSAAKPRVGIVCPTDVRYTTAGGSPFYNTVYVFFPPGDSNGIDLIAIDLDDVKHSSPFRKSLLTHGVYSPVSRRTTHGDGTT